MKPSAQELYAQLYDASVSDWPGELEFYRELIENSRLQHHGVLEIACGTGRIASQLAQNGLHVTGLDISPELLEIAHKKSAHLPDTRWVQADMRSFDLGAQFGIIIIPGHSFQFMNTAPDQVRCLECIQAHLVPGGILVVHLDHQDIDWLAGLLQNTGLVYKKGALLTHPHTGQVFQRSSAWEYDRASQTATVYVRWEELDLAGQVTSIWELEPMPLHCVFRFEMEHLLRRVGYSVEAIYGDFFKNELRRRSSEMIWVARNLV